MKLLDGGIGLGELFVVGRRGLAGGRGWGLGGVRVGRGWGEGDFLSPGKSRDMGILVER